MFVITKEFSFSASHKLCGLEEGHPCMNTHGHNYRVIVEMSDKRLNKNGFILDYRKFAEIKIYLDRYFDHQDITSIFSPANPSAENIAKYLYDIFTRTYPLLTAITVSETDKTFATYRPNLI